MRLIRFIILILLLLRPGGLLAQSDTSRMLKSVNVQTQKQTQNIYSVVPVQTLQQNDLDNINSLSVADAAKYFSGVQVKDYGGVGGLKTIAVRGLSANYTGVSYNGILLNDVQNGQTDLGKYSLSNVSEISLYNAQINTLLQPARAYSYGSVIDIKTIPSEYTDSQKMKMNVSLQSGSFGLFNPTATIRYKWSNKIFGSLNADWTRYSGDYNFTYGNGNVTQKGRRTNDKINAYHIAYDTKYIISDSNTVEVNVYYYNSYQGLPGAIILYSGQSRQQEWDDNFFAQATWNKKISAKSRLLVAAKYNYAYTDYLDTTYQNTQHRLEMIFRQRELYASGAYVYQLFSFLGAAYSTDFFMDNLHGNLPDFATPARYTLLNNLSAQFSFSGLNIVANILNTTVNNKVAKGSKPPNYQHFSPVVAFNYQPVKNIPLTVRVFYKNIFRMPTFNDLYYTNVGNVNLKPEYTKQLDAGISWRQYIASSFIKSIELSADGYYNYVDDMIVAIPQQNIAQWSMQNVSKAFIKGMDITSKFDFVLTGNWHYSLQANYTLQRAINNDPSSLEYENEIPYMPKQFGSFNFSADYKSFSFGWNALFSGFRYAAVYNSADNLMPKWNTQDAVVAYKFRQKKSDWKLIFQVNNLFNQQYQIVDYYPMPGRNFRIGIRWNI